MLHKEKRRQLLKNLGATDLELEELLLYNENHFVMEKDQDPFFPMEDEPFVPVWKEYEEESLKKGVFPTLKKYLVQFHFPIKEGISKTDAYKGVTLKGNHVSKTKEATGLSLKSPDSLQLTIYQTLAGSIPILYTRDREDFKTLVQALSLKNEPHPIPDSMGACMVKGLNNWDRVKRSGMMLFTLIPYRSLYQDKLILLSGGNYSGVSAKMVGLAQSEWEDLSLLIRREHECTHYITQRWFGSAKNNLLDELIADYVGITEGAGSFMVDWALKFMGLEDFPNYRKGGRMENYQGDPPISQGAFLVIKRLAYGAILGLERLDKKWKDLSKGEKIKLLCSMNLEELL